MEQAHRASVTLMADALGMSASQMRDLGHRIVDLVVDHIEGLSQTPALVGGDPAELWRALGGGQPPRQPGDVESLIALVETTVLGTMQHGDHPRYFARVPGPSSFAGVAGDWLAAGFNGIASSWGGGAGPSAAELVSLDWLRTLMGMPTGTEGIVLSGGSLANLTALALARHECGDGVVYFSDQTHSCVAKALHVLDVPQGHRRMLSTGRMLRLSRSVVEQAIDDDRRRGLTPTVIVATAGTTNTGACDDLDGLARLAADNDMWLHVDGAYGAPARLGAPCPPALEALGVADSLVIDPHKWLFQPYDIACLLVSRPGALERCYSMNPEYLADVVGADGEIDLRNRGPELTRRARALKLWFTLSLHGVERIGEAVSAGIANAERAEAQLRSDPQWEVVTPAQLGIVTFVRRGIDDEGHQAAVRNVTRSGYAALTCTSLFGRQVFRLCLINPRTTAADIEGTLSRLAAACE